MYENTNSALIINKMIDDLTYFRRAINGASIGNIEELYEAINEHRKLFYIIVDEIIMKQDFSEGENFYSEFYDILIPFLRDTLVIDNIKFEKTEIDANHKVLLNIFIEDIWYGTLDIFEREYHQPNVPRMIEIEKQALELQKEIDEKTEEMEALAFRIKYPKQAGKIDKDFRRQYRLSKKRTLKKLTEEFFALDRETSPIQAQLNELNLEYENYQSMIGSDERFYDEKLENRLKERLNIEIIKIESDYNSDIQQQN